MATWLKQSTVVTVQLGAFLDATDGVVPETGLATNMDNATTGIRVSKNGVAMIDRNSATVPAHDDDGHYRIELSATDTDTLGELRIQYEESGVTTPAWRDFMVVPANVFDSFFGADNLQVDQIQIVVTTVPTPTTVGVPDVNVERWLDTLVTLGAGAPDVNVQSIDANAINAASIAAAAMDDKGNWNVGKSGYSLTLANWNVGKSGYALTLADWNTVVPDAAGIAATPAEVATALTDIHLDHLFNTDYDPTAKPGVATALLNELIESDAGVSRYTANALEQIWAVGTRTLTVADWNVGKAGYSLTLADWNVGKAGYTLSQAFPTNFSATAITAGGVVDADVTAINSSTTAAVQLALSANQIESGQFEGTPSVTVLQTDLAETQDDIYIGRTIIITSGNAQSEASDITDYVGSTGTLTVTALANAPASSDTFILI